MMKKIRERKGFTLAELLIVVAIIAVLVAVAIPVFTAQLERARQAADLANIRSSYAEAVSTALSTNAAATGTEEFKVQNTHGKLDEISLDGLTGALKDALNSSTAVSGTIQVSVDAEGNVTAITK